MELQLSRTLLKADRTEGKLMINNSYECDTLEDTVRLEKIAGKTAIAKGRYEVIINFSNRFQQLMPLLLRVKNFEGVRIHAGNTPADTEGCILVGTRGENGTLTNSRLAYRALFAKLDKAAKTEKIFITIV